MQEVEVSVVIPSYNSARYVVAAVESVLAQTYRDFEILVVDDGSTDNTKEVLGKYGDAVRYLYKPNGGVSAARNYGIEKARGKYVAFLDADDLWMPEKLENQVALLELNADVGLSYTSAIIVDENLETKSYIEAKEYDDACEALLLQMNILILSSSIVRKDVLLQTKGFDSQFSTCADKDFWLRLSLLTKFAPVREYLVKYRDVSGSMSSNPYISKRDTEGVLNKFFALPDLPLKYKKMKNQSLSNNLMVVAGEFLHNGIIGESMRCLLKSVRLYPHNIIRPLGMPFRLAKRLLPN
jgi:glycosyltransferase involved in cell wall biosynthesis